MKSGILPVSSVSDAHLRPHEVFPQSYHNFFFLNYHYVYFRKFAIEKSCDVVHTLSGGFLN